MAWDGVSVAFLALQEGRFRYVNEGGRLSVTPKLDTAGSHLRVGWRSAVPWNITPAGTSAVSNRCEGSASSRSWLRVRSIFLAAGWFRLGEGRGKGAPTLRTAF